MKTEETLFAEAIQLQAADRANFIDHHCSDDDELRIRIEKLIAAHESEDSLLDHADSFRSTLGNYFMDVGEDAGPYRLLEKLGEGGFGVVFKAEQRHPLQRLVAVKVIKPGMDSRAVVARFEAEQQALALMNHPNIANVFDGGTVADGSRPYFVMELVEGVSITEYCDTNALSIASRLELFISVCNAVHHAHQKGIIHRDIKPSNVMVTQHDGKPIVKVIDFGVAKALRQRLSEKTAFTQDGMMIGTPQYMSPEQAQMNGIDIDTRSDVYSLAVLLYELITGTTPLQADSLRTASFQEIQRMIREDEPVIPSQRVSSRRNEDSVTLAKHRSISVDRLPSEIRGDLDWIVMKGLDKDRLRRYDSASDFAADVRRAMDHEPVEAGPPGIPYRARKFLRRNRTAVAAALSATIILAALAIGFINHRYNTLAAKELDEQRLTEAVDKATAAMATAIESGLSDEDWSSADLLAARVQEIASESNASEPDLLRAKDFLGRYESAKTDLNFVASMEKLLVERATNRNLESWTKVEKEFRKILRVRGYDVDVLSPTQLGDLLRNGRAKVKVTDALELWLDTRIQLTGFGGPPVSSDEVKAWTDAMCVADPDPLRTAIRETVFLTITQNKSRLEAAVSSNGLDKLCPRKLSWLAQAFNFVGDSERAQEIQNYALSRHSDDLMLNFEFAVAMMEEEKLDLAIRHLMRCTAIRPKLPGVWRALANAYQLNGETDLSLDAAKAALKLDREQSSINSELSSKLSEPDIEQ